MTVPRFPISFPDGHVALAVRADPRTDLPRALRAMGLTTGIPTIVLVHIGSRPAQLSRLGPLLEKVVVPVAGAVDGVLVDDGTHGALATLLTAARRRCEAGFPLLGVAAEGADLEDLDSGHTHFVLVPADHRPEIAGWIASVATAVAGGNRSVALALAGGEPAWESLAAQIRADRVVMAVARSGGVADQLAAALAGRPADGRAHELAASGHIFAVDPARGAAHVADTLRSALSRPDALNPAPQEGVPQH